MKSYCVREKRETECVPGSEQIGTVSNGRLMMRCKCASCGITKTQFISGQTGGAVGNGAFSCGYDLKGKRAGTLEECFRKGQIRQWGLKRFKKDDLDDLLYDRKIDRSKARKPRKSEPMSKERRQEYIDEIVADIKKETKARRKKDDPFAPAVEKLLQMNPEMKKQKKQKIERFRYDDDTIEEDSLLYPLFTPKKEISDAVKKEMKARSKKQKQKQTTGIPLNLSKDVQKELMENVEEEIKFDIIKGLIDKAKEKGKSGLKIGKIRIKREGKRWYIEDRTDPSNITRSRGMTTNTLESALEALFSGNPMYQVIMNKYISGFISRNKDELKNMLIREYLTHKKKTKKEVLDLASRFAKVKKARDKVGETDNEKIKRIKAEIKEAEKKRRFYEETASEIKPKRRNTKNQSYVGDFNEDTLSKEEGQKRYWEGRADLARQVEESKKWVLDRLLKGESLDKKPAPKPQRRGSISGMRSNATRTRKMSF